MDPTASVDWGAVGAVATIALAVMTGGLALKTAKMAGETRNLVAETKRTRDEEALARRRGALRAALVEQLRNCRFWFSHDYARGPGSPAVVPLVGWTPSFARLIDLLAAVDLPEELVAYLVWSLDEVQADIGRVSPLLSMPLDGPDSDPQPRGNLRDLWEVILERLQVVAALLRAEATRQGADDVAESFDARWLVPRSWPPDASRASAQQSERAYFSAPAWPSDPAYASCSPAERDRRANAVSAQERSALREGRNVMRGRDLRSG